MTNLPYVIAASAIWAVWGVSWMLSAFWTARRVKRAAGGTFRLQLGIVFLGYALLFFEPADRRHILWLLPVWLGWTMVGLVLVGCLSSWWARVQLGALWSAGITRREGHRIVESGPYAIVRHPIYTAIILGVIGLAVVKATAPALVGAALVALGFGLKARVEERFLAAELGEKDYADYRRRVPMLVPLGKMLRVR